MNKAYTTGAPAELAKVEELGWEPTTDENAPHWVLEHAGQVRVLIPLTDAQSQCLRSRVAIGRERMAQRARRLVAVGLHAGSHAAAVKSYVEDVLFSRGYVRCSSTANQVDIPRNLDDVTRSHLDTAELARRANRDLASVGEAGFVQASAWNPNAVWIGVHLTDGESITLDGWYPPEERNNER